MNSYKLYAVNYADPAYEFRRKVNTDSLKKFGKVDEVFEYGSASIPEFIEAHPDLFKYKFGAGMHSWKPYIILKALDNIKDGDWLFYCDCGAEIIDDVHKLTDHAITDGEDFMVFQLLWATTREYTKAEVIRWLYVENPDLPQVLSGFIFMKKNTKTVALIQEWLNLCIVEKYIACERFDETIPNDPIFKVHRDDQSLLDIVVRKHGIRPYRDPSDYFLDMQPTNSGNAEGAVVPASRCSRIQEDIFPTLSPMAIMLRTLWYLPQDQETLDKSRNIETRTFWFRYMTPVHYNLRSLNLPKKIGCILQIVEW